MSDAKMSDVKLQEMNPALKDFLLRHSLLPECVDIDSLCNFKISEMKAGLSGKPGSLAMLNSYCRPPAELPLNRKVAVIDAGGTNLRTCSVYFNKDKEPVFEDYKAVQMPGIEHEVGAEEFFSIFADQVERFADSIDTFGFCFSYATEILPDHDGVPLLLSKEVRAPEVVGLHLGRELFARLSARGHNMEKSRIIVMNDTVTTLLAGLSELEKTGCGGCVGFILGTGTNTAFMSSQGIINEESANLKVPLGDIDSLFAGDTLDPESHLLEKLVSGAYLGPLSLYVIRTAIKENLFSREFASGFETVQSLSTLEMCSLLEKSGEFFDRCRFEGEDYNTLRIILENFIERAAKLAAANLAASVLMTVCEDNSRILINADGTTFYHTPGLKQKTEEYLNGYLAGKGKTAVFTNIRRSPMIGSAIGALSL